MKTNIERKSKDWKAQAMWKYHHPMMRPDKFRIRSE